MCQALPHEASLKEIAVRVEELPGGAEVPQPVTTAASAAPTAAASRRLVRMAFLGNLLRGKWPQASIGSPKPAHSARQRYGRNVHLAITRCITGGCQPLALSLAIW